MYHPVLNHYPDEAAHLGRMVVGYGEIELTFVSCAGLALNNHNLILRAVHTLQSESGRLKLANSLSVDAYHELGLKNEYAEAYGAVRFCLKTRNHYAHAQFGYGKNDILVFSNPDETFASGSFHPQWKGLTVDLLRDQEAYFGYARELLMWMEEHLQLFHEQQGHQKEARPPVRNKPARMPQPPTHIDL